MAAKGESEPERRETRSKVEDDRKHEYPFNKNDNFAAARASITHVLV